MKSDNETHDAAAIAKSLKEKTKEFKNHEKHDNIKVESYIHNAENRPAKKPKSSKPI
ncbi:hypothetical protein MA16_Dca019985 [Dendrobium catenatum]|uniref:Uncharacterized protein n=1 Tax=Dendrobium catenatum TaxID=906689 RepID=A0A2I0WCK9_9ASPA|nr:hypothetical protein MA16_Dca019985 [Dendrobium catenatum]